MIGQTISHYKIIEKLGEGGMGVVYKAEDTTLDRLVALKFLPPSLHAGQAEKARFMQEAKAAAALNHPNICSVIAIDDSDGQMFIVMEYIEGTTLRDKQSTLSFKQAIDIGIQVADGLAAAHEKGIVHRDIKPENIMIRKDGIAQIMDFGLAKLRSSGSKITRLTREGSTVGTAGYMSPEQVQGHEVDHRSDIFSYGVLLYELLTGQLPFKGVHETALAYEIVNVDAAPMSSIKPEIDPSLDAIVLECMEKDLNERAQGMKQVSVDLRRYKRESSRQRASRITAVRPAFNQPKIQPEGPVATAQTSTRAGRSRNLPWILSIVFFLVAVGAIAMHFLNRGEDKKGIVRFVIPSPEGGAIGRSAPQASPDGEKIAFVASDSTGKSSIWIRDITSLTARALLGTEDATFPFWSPDSRFIAYFVGGKLKKLDVNGGPPQTICDASDGRGGSWGSQGIIVFAPGYGTAIQKVSASGGIPTEVTSLDTSLKEDSHRWPSFLPDGQRFLYVRRGASEQSGVYIGSLDSREFTLVIPSKANAIYTPEGYLLFLREATLMAQPFDAAKAALSGEPISIADQIGVDIGYSLGFFSASQNGVLALGAGSGISYRQLVWYNRLGNRLKTVGNSGALFDFALSPDENRVVFRRVDQQTGNHDLWILDLIRLTESRFTFLQTLEDDPVWSPDGNSIIFDSNPDGISNLYRKVASGAGKDELLLKSSVSNFPVDYSSDGRYILYTQNFSQTHRAGLWVLPLFGDKKPSAIVQGDLDATIGKFSPNGQWIAYSSNESGKPEVYVQTFPTTEAKWQISTNGGSAPQWSRDGKELYYISPNRKLMSVDVTTAGGSFIAGIPRQLFEVDIDRYTAPNRYAVAKDKMRFLLNVPADESKALPLAVVLNWTEDLEKK